MPAAIEQHTTHRRSAGTAGLTQLDKTVAVAHWRIAEQVLQPNAELRPGSRYQIVVTADGKIEASFADGH